ncbi:MAG: threonine--tRNA ligase [Myxococcota bacterium]|nr:threonine--tRNA ligase [Myxococcota bacterium]
MSEQITIYLPDGATKTLESGQTAHAVAAQISEGLARQAVGAKVNGEVCDLHRPLADGDQVQLLTPRDAESLEILRHSTAHILASAVKRLFPKALISIGPVVDDGVNGFYYDFEMERPFTPDDLVEIEAEMKRVIGEKSSFQRVAISREDAKQRFEAEGEPYKLELLDAADGEITLYTHGEFNDLCRGPHLPDTGRVKCFKLLSQAGAYWRGDSNNTMLQRIYGTAFFDKKELKKHLHRLEEAKKRDHRRLGRELGLFTVSEKGDLYHDENEGRSYFEEIGQGLVLWLPRGARIRTILEDFWRRTHRQGGYEPVYSPHVAHSDLWRISGHLGFYNESMYKPIAVDDEEYLLKPMNCPFHVMIYKTTAHSYRDLPVRLAELGTVYRYELAGALHGLMRVRGFTQDDAHIICAEESLEDELNKVLRLALEYLRAFGFEAFDIMLSTRPEKFVGEPSLWARAEKALEGSIRASGLDFAVDEGGGAFYGPKIDIKIKDAIGRTWQCSTIQLDFNLPKRFQMTYTNRDGEKVPPILIHRAIMGSLERFFGILTEHYAGDFPAWLAPEQARILTISERAEGAASQLLAACQARDLRVEVDTRNESLGKKIRDARLMRVPYLFVLGDREVDEGTAAVRSRQGEQFGTLTHADAVDWLAEKSVPPSLDLC